MATQICLEFSPQNIGEGLKNLTSIFFKWVGSTTNQKRSNQNPPKTFVEWILLLGLKVWMNLQGDYAAVYYSIPSKIEWDRIPTDLTFVSCKLELLNTQVFSGFVQIHPSQFRQDWHSVSSTKDCSRECDLAAYNKLVEAEKCFEEFQGGKHTRAILHLVDLR